MCTTPKMNKRLYISGGVFILFLFSIVLLFAWTRNPDGSPPASHILKWYDNAAVQLLTMFQSIPTTNTYGSETSSRRPQYTNVWPTEQNNSFYTSYDVDQEEDMYSPEDSDYDPGEHKLWLDLEKLDEKRKKRVGKWPEGIVSYVINAKLSFKEKHYFSLALGEFHEKTCVKFEPRANNNIINYVGIERNDQMANCGKADICMRGRGYQTASFRTECMNKATFVHELAHTLCIGHEFNRMDVDNFLNFKGCNNSNSKKKYIQKGIFDYASQMNYECGTCDGGHPIGPVPPLCGEQVQNGLSVMDAEAINELYNCQACFRHRWRPINNLTKEDLENLYSFGSVDYNGKAMFPCRALHNGEVAVGSYIDGDKFCTIPSFRSNTSILVKTNAEVLTIPGGLSSNCRTGDKDSIFQYELHNNQIRSYGNILKEAVPSASVITWDGKYYVGYIAFGTVATIKRSYKGEGITFYGMEDVLHGVDVIGTAWNTSGSFDYAMFPKLHGRGVNIENIGNFKVLVCRERFV